MEKLIYTKGKIFMVSNVIWKWLYPQLTWLIKFSALTLLLINLLKMIQIIYRQSLHLFVLEIRLFVNDVEQLYTRLNNSQLLVLNFSHTVFGEIWINLMHFMMMNQLNHQNNGTYKLHQFSPNPTPLPRIPVLCYQKVDNVNVEVYPSGYPLEYTS